MKLADVTSSMYINFNKENNKEGPKFKIGEHLNISKYKNIFAKDNASNLSEEVFVIKKVKNTMSWTYVFSDLNEEEIVWTFSKKEIQKTNEKEFGIEKAIKRKGDELYVKWKGYYNLSNSWISKKGHSINKWIISRTEIFRRNEKVMLLM